MATAAPGSRPTRSAAPAVASNSGKRMSLAEIVGKGSGLPGRYILHGVEGVGKTSFAAFAPRPIFIQTAGETGLETLIDSGRLPEIPHWPAVRSWDELLGAINALTNDPHEYRTLVFDTLNGAERLCFDEVTRRDFNGCPGEKGFAGYSRGAEVSQVDWRMMFAELDALRESRRMAILCLCHTRVKPFKNPEGPDYDRFAPDMHEKSWGNAHKWADAVLFMNYETFFHEGDGKKTGKVKAASTQTRLMFTERHAAYDAKNRFGLPAEIELGESGEAAWQSFADALKAAKQTTTETGKDGE